MEKYIIKFYKLDNGKKPIELFLDSLNIKMRIKVIRSLELLEEFGKDLRYPNSRYIDDGIFELRVQLASNIVRIFYFFDKNKIIVLTNAYNKKQQKLSKKDFNLAKKYMKNYKGEQK